MSNYHKPNQGNRCLLTALGIVAITTVTLAVHGWLGQRRYQKAIAMEPDAIVVLGGGVLREIGAAQLAGDFPEIPIYVSSGSPDWCLRSIFEEERGIEFSRVTSDFRARNTLTNFAALLPYLETDLPRNVLLVTDSGNWNRAERLSNIMWRRRGIAVTPAIIDGVGSSRGESAWKTRTQSVLAWAWVVFGDAVLPGPMWNDQPELGNAPRTSIRECTWGYPETVTITIYPF